MPLLLPPLNRRQFLGALSAAVVSLPALRINAAQVDDDLLAILNDTHIGEKQKPDTAIPSHLKATVDYLLGLQRQPAAVLINGDLALRDGQAGDYRFFARLIAPLREAGMSVHLTLGNHDDREVFYQVLTEEKPSQPVVVARHVGVLSTRKANWFLLDSLKQTMIAQGELGEVQLKWLGKALDAHRDKPAIVMAHHNPRLGGDPKHFPGGLEDSQPLWDLLARRRHVKAYVHGHIHHWSLARHEGIHIVNTPATSYVGDPKISTTGWTMARLRNDGVTVTTLTHQTDHEWNNQSHDLKWRA